MSNQTTQTLFTATDSIAASAGSPSRIASVQSRGQVALFIENGSGTNLTVTVCAGAATPGQPAGRNSLGEGADASDLFPLYKPDGSGLLTFSVAGGTKRSIDLSSFAPEFVGIIAAAGTGPVTGVVAYASAHA